MYYCNYTATNCPLVLSYHTINIIVTYYFYCTLLWFSMTSATLPASTAHQGCSWNSRQHVGPLGQIPGSHPTSSWLLCSNGYSARTRSYRSTIWDLHNAPLRSSAHRSQHVHNMTNASPAPLSILPPRLLCSPQIDWRILAPISPAKPQQVVDNL